MSVGISFTLCSFFFIVLLTVVFFSKKRLVSIENTIYSYIILTSLFGTMIGVPCYYFMKDYEFFGVANIITSKAYLVYLVTWITLFTAYIFIISIKKINKKKVLNIFTIIFILLSLIVCVLPLYYKSENGIVYSYGPSANFMYLASAIAIVIILICIIINIKYIKQKKFLPVIAFIIIGTIIMTIQKMNPGLLLITFGEAFITFLMYFTIENPDMKLIKELNENRVLVEKNNEEKSNFLFKMTAEIRNPINFIYKTSEELLNEKSREKLQTGIRTININSRKVSYLINDVLNISSLDVKNMKFIDKKYNIYNIIDEIKKRLNSEKKDNVDFRYNISENIPKELYGDAIKVKQILMTILMNSVKYTKNGFIELNITPMIKYDTCRLIISIEDSGIGMNLSLVNDLLNMDEDLTDEDLSKLGKIDLNLNIVKKIIKYLGGSVMIKSEDDKGTEFTIILDQKIGNDKNIGEFSKYNKVLFKKKRVLLVNDDIKELNQIEQILKKEDISVVTTMYGRDCINKVIYEEKFDLIIIDDEMPEFSGLDTLKELKKIEEFNIPIIITLGREKDNIKDHYIKDGFKDYIVKEQLDSEVKRIIEKYL